MRLVFWQNTPSPHQAPLLRALAGQPGVGVELVAAVELPRWRRNMGWSPPDFGAVRVVVGPGERECESLVAEAMPDSVHIFSGIGAYPFVDRALRRAIYSPMRIGVMAEAADWTGWKGAARLARARLRAVPYRRRVDFILAIGSLAEHWFRLAGYPSRIIHPFGYFVETPAAPLTRATGADAAGPVRIVFVGQCVRRKGGDILLRALAGMRELPWNLTVVGDGEARKSWERLADRLRIDERTVFVGALPNDAAMDILSGSDLLVLPSRWDGWGAVVNEALMRGIPVVCSNRCGAAELLDDEQRGSVFDSGSVTGLRGALTAWVARGRRTEESRRRIARWSSRITGDVAATYLLEILEAGKAGTRPRAPWRSSAEPGARAIRADPA